MEGGDGPSGPAKKGKVDYKASLDPASFARFTQLREIRKRVAKEDAVPAYAVFTDQELAELAKLESITLEVLGQIKGIGRKKLEKYGSHFISEDQS